MANGLQRDGLLRIAAFALDSHPAVVSWVKNDHLGFAIPYRKRNIAAKYLPDFIVVVDRGLRLIVEIKGQHDGDADVKAKAAERWVQAVNATVVYGQWAYVLIDDPQRLGMAIEAADAGRESGIQWA